jgi:hypothetical protein
MTLKVVNKRYGQSEIGLVVGEGNMWYGFKSTTRTEIERSIAGGNERERKRAEFGIKSSGCDSVLKMSSEVESEHIEKSLGTADFRKGGIGE